MTTPASCNYKPTKGVGLYLMVFVTMLSTCRTETMVANLEREPIHVEVEVMPDQTIEPKEDDEQG